MKTQVLSERAIRDGYEPNQGDVQTDTSRVISHLSNHIKINLGLQKNQICFLSLLCYWLGFFWQSFLLVYSPLPSTISSQGFIGKKKPTSKLFLHGSFKFSGLLSDLGDFLRQSLSKSYLLKNASWMRFSSNFFQCRMQCNQHEHMKNCDIQNTLYFCSEGKKKHWHISNILSADH